MSGGVTAAYSPARCSIWESPRPPMRSSAVRLLLIIHTIASNSTLWPGGSRCASSPIPLKWIAQYGDPRDAKVDAIDWVDRIPFPETRNYVQRVMENLQVYRVRFGEKL